TLQTDIDDPSERLRAIAASDARAKEHSASLGPTLLVDLAQSIPRGAFGWLLGLMARTPLSGTAIHNVVISNVAGPTETLYSAGA
ncbi:wax ester/triacylglycerol synthase family O-acyltransferase, partial [Mycobacterium sp. ITM-2017-0098]